MATLARIMLPGDANPAGNVHGGTILRMVDEAGSIAGMRHANSLRISNTYVALARIETMAFQAPMFVGELASLKAEVTHASERSCEVLVEVTAENLVTGDVRSTNRARLWYVATNGELREEEPRFAAVSMPPLSLSEASMVAGQRRYELQQATRRAADPELAYSAAAAAAAAAAAVGEEGGATLSQLMLPGDVNAAGFVQAGVILKLMDNAAGICAVRHCRTNVVTAVLDALDFKAPVFNGCVVRVDARASFASSRSLEVEVVVHAESHSRNNGEPYLAVHGFLTFVSLDKEGRPLVLPPLSAPRSDVEVAGREAGRLRYEARKTARKAAAQKREENSTA